MPTRPLITTGAGSVICSTQPCLRCLVLAWHTVLLSRLSSRLGIGSVARCPTSSGTPCRVMVTYSMTLNKGDVISNY
nr:ORF4 [Lake Sinai virus 4]